LRENLQFPIVHFRQLNRQGISYLRRKPIHAAQLLKANTVEVCNQETVRSDFAADRHPRDSKNRKAVRCGKLDSVASSPFESVAGNKKVILRLRRSKYTAPSTDSNDFVIFVIGCQQE
jgi:hypothetical protein